MKILFNGVLFTKMQNKEIAIILLYDLWQSRRTDSMRA